MTNYEKYKDEINSKEPSCVDICRMRGSDCNENYCTICKYLNYKWLDAEYIEPEIDWSKVEQGTMVYANVHDKEGSSGKFVSLYQGDKVVIEVSTYVYKSYHKNYCRLEK